MFASHLDPRATLPPLLVLTERSSTYTALAALLIEREPNNLQAQSLQELIEKGVAREGYIGMALMGGAAALGGVVLAGLLRRRR